MLTVMMCVYTKKLTVMTNDVYTKKLTVMTNDVYTKKLTVMTNDVYTKKLTGGELIFHMQLVQ